MASPSMEWVKDKTGLGFGCNTIQFILHHSSPSLPLSPHLPTSTTPLHLRLKEAVTSVSFHRAMSGRRVEKAEHASEDIFLGMENKGFSECSSGCQSGWTLYLDNSLGNPTSSLPPKPFACSGYEDDGEDLSMLSDASSGPPQAVEEDLKNYCFGNNGDGFVCYGPPISTPVLAKKGTKRRSFEEGQHPTQGQSFLDDTASSPMLCFTKTNNSSSKYTTEDVLDPSCGFSATHFKGKNTLQKHLGYLHSPSSLNATPVCREEEKKKLL